MKTLFTLLFPATLLLASCTADHTPGIDPVTPPVPLTVESAAIDATMITTRANPMLTSGSIGIFLSGTGYTAVTNRRYDYASPAWTPNGGATNAIYLAGSTASVCAYYPWQSGISNSTAVLLTSQVQDDVAKDISFALNRDMDGSSANSSTTFAMKHAYAKVTFTFQRSNYPGICEVQKVELKNILASTTLNIGTGKYATSTGSTAGTVSQTKNVTVPTSGTVSWGSDILLVPCTPASTGIMLTITVDGKTMTTTIPKETYKPVAGEYKTIAIIVQGTAINATGVTTTDWVNGNISSVIPLP